MNILVGHLVGDFLLQNKWIASRKHSNWSALFLHCVLVTVALLVFTWWPWYQLLLIFATHCVIDGLKLGSRYSNWVGQGTPGSDGPAPLWLILMSDQTMHLVCYCLIA